MDERGEGQSDFLRDEWRAMQRRLVAHLASSPRASDVSEAPTTIAASVYTDPARFEAERRAIFREQPLLAGFTQDVPEPGDRLLFDAAGPPILIVRGRDARLRAFLNLCTHRGTRLVSDCARTRRLTCPLHAWSFDLDGELATMPQQAAFDGLDRTSRSLVAVPVAEWHGMIFVVATPRATPLESSADPRAGASGASRAASPDATIDVESFLGPIGPVLAALDLGALETVRQDELRVASNWKMALDTFCETYHVPSLHKDSLSRTLVPYVVLFDHYGLHHRYSGPGLDFEALLGKPESDWPAAGYQAVHYLFPNTTIAFTHALDGKTPVVSMFRLFPGESVGESITLGSTHRRADARDVPDEEVARMHDIVIEIVRSEDYRAASEARRGVESAPPGFRFVFGRNEALLQRYHRDLAAAIGMPLP